MVKSTNRPAGFRTLRRTGYFYPELCIMVARLWRKCVKTILPFCHCWVTGV